MRDATLMPSDHLECIWILQWRGQDYKYWSFNFKVTDSKGVGSWVDILNSTYHNSSKKDVPDLGVGATEIEYMSSNITLKQIPSCMLAVPIAGPDGNAPGNDAGLWLIVDASKSNVSSSMDACKDARAMLEGTVHRAS